MPRARDGTDRDGSSRRWIRGFLALAGLAMLAFLVSLAATVPVRLAAGYVAAPVWINGYSGTLWRGVARIDGGHAVAWQLDALRSLAELGVALDVAVTGPGTELAGRAALRGASGQDIGVDGLTGRAAWPLVAALAPDLDFACDGAAVLQDVALRLAPGTRSGAGSLRSGAATCREARGASEPVAVPALAGRLETTASGLRATLVQAAAPETLLAEALATEDGRLVVTLHPAGAALVPGAPVSGEISLEYPLQWPLR